MKNNIHSRALLTLILATMAATPVFTRAADVVTPPATDRREEQPTYLLFTGTDIQVLYQNNLYGVLGVQGSVFIIKVEGKDVEIPMDENPQQLKVASVQRLTERSANITKFKYDRSYSAANDPYRKWDKARSDTAALDEFAATAATNLRKTPTRIEVLEAGEVKLVDNPNYSANTHISETASSGVSANTHYTDKLSEDLGRELFDALEIKFEVFSPTQLISPYVVLTGKFHEKDDPKHPRNWLYAKALDPINDVPQKISIWKAGFPPGFVVENLQLHLYQDGLEIATDLSENRARLARDEAHEYLVIDHISTHKTDTLPARIALCKMPPDWATHPKDDAFRKTYYVKVDKEGHPVGSFEDEACKTKVTNVYYEGLLKDMLFLPALERGKPVECVARVKLTEIAM